MLGRKIMLDAQPFEVVGVMPPGTDHPGNSYNAVAYGQTVDIWTPFTFEGNPARRGSHYVEAIGRLKPGVTAGAGAGGVERAAGGPRDAIHARRRAGPRWWCRSTRKWSGRASGCCWCCWARSGWCC